MTNANRRPVPINDQYQQIADANKLPTPTNRGYQFITSTNRYYCQCQQLPISTIIVTDNYRYPQLPSPTITVVHNYRYQQLPLPIITVTVTDRQPFSWHFLRGGALVLGGLAANVRIVIPTTTVSVTDGQPFSYRLPLLAKSVTVTNNYRCP